MIIRIIVIWLHDFSYVLYKSQCDLTVLKNISCFPSFQLIIVILQFNKFYLQIINEKGEALGPNTDGEILLKSTGAMKGYWGVQELQASFAVDDEGWFHTGDVGRYDKDGYIYVLGRQRDIVSVKNKKVIRKHIVFCVGILCIDTEMCKIKQDTFLVESVL